MNYAKINTHDVANGVGIRVSLFVSGCNIKCPGCFNVEAQDFNYGQPYTNDTTASILNIMDKLWIDGLTILGGEPLDQHNVSAVCSLIETVRLRYRKSRSIWVYTGYTLENLQQRATNDPDLFKILSSIDILVDGPFIEAQKDVSLPFRGSRNQRIIDMPKTLTTGKVVLKGFKG